jgi:hypothetical protein
MSMVTGTQSEVLYSMPANGAAYNTSVTRTLVSANSTTNPPYQFQTTLRNLWGGVNPLGKAIRFTARGAWGDTTTAPTLTLAIALDATQGTFGTALASTGAFTVPGTSVTNGEFELECDAVCQAIGVGATSMTFATGGILGIGQGNNATTVAAASYMVGSASTPIGVNPDTLYWAEVWATWGTSSASNTLTLTHFIIQGLS